MKELKEKINKKILWIENTDLKKLKVWFFFKYNVI